MFTTVRSVQAVLLWGRQSMCVTHIFVTVLCVCHCEVRAFAMCVSHTVAKIERKSQNWQHRCHRTIESLDRQ
jgi:hypothetical protein